METTLAWYGLEYNSREECTVKETRSRISINSEIYAKSSLLDFFTIEYKLILNSKWESISVESSAVLITDTHHVRLQKQENGHWLVNGEINHELDGCIDTDIPNTPLTNTLPIKRLNLNIGESQIIDVVYLDILFNLVRPVKQRYTRLGQNEYKYENVPNDFEAVIKVDDQGFVINYPGLFVTR